MQCKKKKTKDVIQDVGGTNKTQRINAAWIVPDAIRIGKMFVLGTELGLGEKGDR